MELAVLVFTDRHRKDFIICIILHDPEITGVLQAFFPALTALKSGVLNVSAQQNLAIKIIVLPLTACGTL